MTLRVGSLCSGYGGLELGLIAAGWPVALAWYAELDPDASAVMATHHPGVANLGDITQADWSTAEPVDVLTAGYPCQSFSNAGKRKGWDDERAIWPYVADAVRRLRPRILAVENVSAHLVRGFPDVLGQLAALGYDAQWTCIRASDVGAPHQRDRLFALAAPAGSSAVTLAPAGSSAVTLLPTPRATDGTKGGPNQRGSSGDLMLPSAVQTFLPTPTAADGGGGPGHGAMEGSPNLRSVASALLPTPTPTQRDATRGAGWTEEEGRPLSETVMRLLPTPTRGTRGTRGTAERSGAGHHEGWTLCDVAHAGRWGRYTSAIERWERVSGRSAPDPTEPGVRGGPRLSARFVEWMMALPDGHVTDVLSRNAALRVLGNGVVPPQAAAAFRMLSGVPR